MFVIREPVFSVRAATVAKGAVDGEGGLDDGESRGSDWEEFLGRARRKEPRMVERRALGSIVVRRLPKRAERSWTRVYARCMDDDGCIHDEIFKLL